MKNDKREWLRVWNASPDQAEIDDTGNRNYPIDGRETINAEYEQFAKTRTVGEYVEALARARSGDKSLPDDFQDYLAQRIPNEFHLLHAPSDSLIDKHGRIIPAKEAAKV